MAILVTLGVALPASAYDRAIVDELVEEAAQRGLADDGVELLALAPLIQLEEMERWVPAFELPALYRSLVDRLPPGTPRAMASYRLLRALDSVGDPAARALERELGFVVAWRARFYETETSVAAAAEQLAGTGDARTAGERAFGSATETGYLDLGASTGSGGRRTVAIATEIRLDRALRGHIAIAADGSYRLWIDGAPVATQPRDLGGYLLRDQVPIALDRGRHEFVVLLSSERPALGLHARLLAQDGSAAAFEQAASETMPAVDAADGNEDAVDAVVEIVERLGDIPELAAPDRRVAAAYVARWLQPEDPAEPWTRWGQLDGADELGELATLRLAETQGEGWRAESVLRAAWERRPDSKLLGYAWAVARYRELGEQSAHEAQRALARVRQAPDSPLAAHVFHAEMLADQGFPGAAASVLRALDAGSERAPPALLDARLRVAYGSGALADEVTELVARLHRQQRTDIGLAGRLCDRLRSGGRGAEALAIAEELVQARPGLPAALHLLSRERLRSGDAAAAVDAARHAAEIATSDASAWEFLADQLVRLGHDEEAALALARASALRPQDTTLRAARERLSGATDTTERFYSAYRRSLDEARQLRDDTPWSADDAGADFAYVIDQRVIDVHENGLSETWVQQAFDVRTDAGADALRSFAITYSPDSERVDRLDVAILKPDGTTRTAYDQQDTARYSGPSSIYYDVRSRRLYFPELGAGDLLVYEYVVAEDASYNLFGGYFGDFWYVEDHYPKAFARYVLRAPAGLPLHDDMGSLGLGTSTVEERGATVLRTWQAERISRVPREDRAPGLAELFGVINVSTYAEWDALADWYWELIRPQLTTSPELEALVTELTQDASSDEEVVVAIHNWVVRNTRYVGLEFGIHGYKPYRTTECFERRFGDCKDTASLMKVMLRLAGVEAHLVLVRTRDLGRVEGWPPSLAVFNHAIAYVPSVDLYLDGTAGFSGSRELPYLDQGATALVVLDGAGGRLTTLPVHAAAASRSSASFTVDVTAAQAVGHARMRWTGQFAPSLRRSFEAADARVERFDELISREYSGVNVGSAEFDGLADIESAVEVTFDLTGGQWAVRRQGELLIRPLGRTYDLAARFAGRADRTLPLELDHLFETSVDVEIRLPAVADLDDLPDDRAVESRFGSASIAMARDGQRLRTTARFSLDVLRIAPGEYEEFRRFLVDVDALFDVLLRGRVEEDS